MHYAAWNNKNIESVVCLLNNGANIYAQTNVRHDSVSVVFVLCLFGFELRLFSAPLLCFAFFGKQWNVWLHGIQHNIIESIQFNSIHSVALFIGLFSEFL